MDSPAWVVLGIVERSRGRRGEVLVSSWSGGPETFQGRSVFLDGQPAHIDEAWLHDGRLVLKFSGVDSIDAAEALRGREIQVRFEDRLPLADGEYYLSDLVGYELLDHGKSVGRVTGWQETPAATLLTVAHPHGEALVPFVKAICKQVDIPGRRILAELPLGLLEL